MPRVFAFLRAINVGGRAVKMDELCEQFAHLGLKKVETFIASGNLVFESTAKALAQLEKKIEARLLKSFGYEIRTFLRTEADLVSIAQHKPFQASATKTATALNIGFVADPLTAASQKLLLSFKSEVDDFHVNGREIYWLCQIRQSESPFFRVPIEKKLNLAITFRNANTINRLVAKYIGH